MTEPIFKHKLIQALYDLLTELTSGGKSQEINPMFRMIWSTLRPEIPSLLHMLDENDEAMETIKQKLVEVMAADGAVLVMSTYAEAEVVPEEVAIEEQDATGD